MGYITSGATVYIDCFLTQKGKELFFIGEDEDIIVKYFSLGDSDTNYIITNNLNISTQDDNILTEGFIPSITGNYDECAKSIAGGIKLKSEIPIKGVNKVLNQYCEGQTLVETLRDPNGNVFIKKTPYSSSCGFNYYSTPLSQTFTPNIIPSEPTYISGNYDTLYQNYYIAPYTVTIPYGTFTSGVSQLDADNKTINYINDNGQAIANNNVVVTYYSRERYLPNQKIDNSSIFPAIYNKIELFYAPNLFTSNTYIDNNNKINDFVNNSKDNYLNIIKNNTLQLQPISPEKYKGIDNIPTNVIDNIYDDFVDTKSADLTGKVLTFKLKNKLINGKIKPFIFELRNFIVQGTNVPYSNTCTLVNSITGKLQICNLYSFNYPAPQNQTYSNVNYSSSSPYLFLDDNGYDTVVFNLNAPYNQSGLTFDTYKLRIASLNLLYPIIDTDTYIIPETSVTTPVLNNTVYKGSKLYLDKTNKKYNNVDVLI
jgi:hypothetical protein